MSREYTTATTNILTVFGCFFQICGLILSYYNSDLLGDNVNTIESTLATQRRSLYGLTMQFIGISMLTSACAILHSWFILVFILVILVPVWLLSAYLVYFDLINDSKCRNVHVPYGCSDFENDDNDYNVYYGTDDENGGGAQESLNESKRPIVSPLSHRAEPKSKSPIYANAFYAGDPFFSGDTASDIEDS